MEFRRRSWYRSLVGAAVVGGLAAVAVSAGRRRQATTAPTGVEGNQQRRRGTPQDRGQVRSYAVDVERLRQTEAFEPAVEYLTYIQSRRGESSHLLFVRHEDLDAIAALEGERLETFLERLQHLG
ncbi:MAG: hypothetical protein M3O70_09275, partial [Actinomycetota bacterium]|nr:hypothetical protein [Actinomycetota bacterium]